ncbi:tRNA lysidine(34) synthetase TilS [Arenibacter certesii]|uniref:tRNA(Ile)-lysidine synthase n=1 Tax=Arenibacter certesii TaxID=228955 RepID=A0A918IMG4_9FLAO|nr:tRNA lysidine(34) synthetase TilS [Arenibacter certesii]GGW22502.1 tRNA(Ile)-lysidine synthase [Arenibacter certesii]
MLDRFKNHIVENFSHLGREAFVLAISGGVDSVVLAHLCASCKLDFELAHCNFHLREAESDKDEVFVRELADSLGENLHVTHFNTQDYASEHKLSIQIAARELRYAWFKELMQERNIKTLVTAHHADDNLETFLINLSRGTGIEGLTGIPEMTDSISRPLLKFSRDEVLSYAQEQKLEWREDASNQDTKYLRNNIRHTIVPRLKELHPTFLDNFLKTQEHLIDTLKINQVYLKELKERLFIVEDGQIKVATAALLNLQPTKSYLFHFFREYGFTQWEDILGLLTTNSGKEVQSPSHRLLKDREFLLLQEKTSKNDNLYEIHEGTSEIRVPFSMKIDEVNQIEKFSQKVLYLDKETLKYPLILRKREKGDYFYPLGMVGKKKLSKYFKDEKFDKFSKENQWLLCSGNKVVWVIGKRADDRFKITESTKKIVKISLV